MDAAEPPGVVEPQSPPIVKKQIYMIVLQQRRVCREHPQASGHTQMHDEGTLIELNEEVLGATNYAKNLLALQRLGDFDRPAKRRVADHPVLEIAPRQMGLDAAPCGFNFRKFRHQELGPIAQSRFQHEQTRHQTLVAPRKESQAEKRPVGVST